MNCLKKYLIKKEKETTVRVRLYQLILQNMFDTQLKLQYKIKLPTIENSEKNEPLIKYNKSMRFRPGFFS